MGVGTAGFGFGFGFDERAASFVGLVAELGSRLFGFPLAPTPMRTRSGCPLPKFVSSRCWLVSMNLEKLKSRANSLVRHDELVMGRSL